MTALPFLAILGITQMKLYTNRELYDWLVLLASRLEVLGSEALSKDVAMAARTVNTFPATELLGESRIVLRHVLAEENGLLSQTDRAEVQNVLRQVDAAFDQR